MQNETKVSGLYAAACLMASGRGSPTVEFAGNKSGCVAPRFVFADPDGSVSWYLEAWRLDHGVGGEELVMSVKRFTNAVRKLKTAVTEARTGKGSYENGTKTTNGARHSQTRNALRETYDHRVCGFSTEDGYAYLCRCDCGLKHH